MRCFLAIELPEAIIVALDAAGRAIRDLDAGWSEEKWVASEVMHVTLKFLGGVNTSLIDQFSCEFAVAASGQSTFPLQLTALRAVPKPARASMIWTVADDPTGGCAALARTADQIAGQQGLKPDSRPFTAHVTLVRARRVRAIEPCTLADAATRSDLASLSTLSVLSATLFASTLTPQGPIHERLAEFALRAE